MPKRPDPVAIANEKIAAEAERAAAEEAKKKELRDGPDLKRDADAVGRLEAAKRVVIVGAMNNVGLNEPFWNALRRYADHNEAELVVIPLRYRNPTSPGEYSTKGPGWWWPAEVQPFLSADRLKFHDHLYMMGDVRVGATAGKPLTGLEGFGRGASTVFGHPQLAMRTVATPQYELPKLMHTTGSASAVKYSESKAGAKAEFHHSASAVVVERDEDRFHLRQLCADTEGGFYDIDRYYHARGHRKAERAEAVIFGDAHVWWMDPAVRRALFDGDDPLTGVLRPKRRIWHDVIDSYSITHHHRLNPVLRYAKLRDGYASLADELGAVVDFMNDIHRLTDETTEDIVVASNHHEHIAKWVNEGSWKSDSINAEIYLELALAMVRGAQIKELQGFETIDPFAEWVSSRLDSKNVRFLARDESYRVRAIALNLHGDFGPKGARGTLENLAKIGTKLVTGHGHGPGIEKSHWKVGVLTALMEYARKSPSDWLPTNCVIWPNGKRQLYSVIRTSWRA